MLKITIPPSEFYDDSKNEFIETKEQQLSLEHSLVSLSKWESKWKKPFLKQDDRTTEEFIDYIRCMTLTQNVNPRVYYALTKDNIKQISDYINDPMTATWFSDKSSGGRNREIITSEIIYYWMIELNIPFECQKWHLNKLLTLIRVCNEKHKPQGKMSKREIMSRNRSLNNARRKAMNSKG